MARLKVAIIGCGAVTELFHLPALAAHDGVEVTVLVDKRRESAQRLAERYGVAYADTEVGAAIGKADAAIVAVPHQLHAPVSVQLFAGGLHVLVEKPMAMTAADCDAIIGAAEQADRVLAVGMQRRFERASLYVKQLLSAGLLGQVHSVDLRDGGIYGWPVADAGMLKAEAGGGVVTGIGVHALDLLLWWLGDAEQVAYWDDAQGGVEADCRFELALVGGTQATVEFSRTRALRNTWRIVGERASLEIGVGANATLRLYTPAGGPPLLGHVEAPAKETPKDLLARQIDDFTGAIRGGRAPLVSGREARRAVALVEEAWRHRQALELPWHAAPRGWQEVPRRAVGEVER